MGTWVVALQLWGDSSSGEGEGAGNRMVIARFRTKKAAEQVLDFAMRHAQATGVVVED